MPIKAIETRYAGCRFRSRLEARWAVFFDHLRQPWLYEPQGWQDMGAPHLPDFYLPRQNLWFEVKGNAAQLGDPKDPTSWFTACRRYALLAKGTKRRVILAVGDIPRPDYDVYDYHDVNFMEVFHPDSWDNYQAWCRCDLCGVTDIHFEGRLRGCTCHQSDRANGSRHPDVLAAYDAARSGRFEHGGQT